MDPAKSEGLAHAEVPPEDHLLLTTPSTLAKGAMVVIPREEEDRLRQGEPVY